MPIYFRHTSISRPGIVPFRYRFVGFIRRELEFQPLLSSDDFYSMGVISFRRYADHVQTDLAR